ncbi:hypothetical protein Tco_1354832 [Tanacetum coccineum]
MVEHDETSNHVGDEELKSIDGVRIRRMTKKKFKKDNKGVQKESDKEWKLNKKTVPHNENFYHYRWHPTEIPHLNHMDDDVDISALTKEQYLALIPDNNRSGIVKPKIGDDVEFKINSNFMMGIRTMDLNTIRSFLIFYTGLGHLYPQNAVSRARRQILIPSRPVIVQVTIVDRAELRDMSDDVDISTLTIEQYLALIQDNNRSGIVKPKIGDDVEFEINSNFMRELRRKCFAGIDDEDAHKHVRRVLEIVDLFHFPGVTHDVVMLRVFPITLKGWALRWKKRLPAGMINTWDLLKKEFI